jgi:hypothetical protein
MLLTDFPLFYFPSWYQIVWEKMCQKWRGEDAVMDNPIPSIFHAFPGKILMKNCFSLQSFAILFRQTFFIGFLLSAFFWTGVAETRLGLREILTSWDIF